VNKSELVSRLTARLDGDRVKAMAAVNGVLEEIEQSLARGEKVSLFGFGTFDRRERGPRTVRNPATGESIQLGASVAPVFRAGAGLKQLLADAAGTARSAAGQATSAVASVPGVAVGLAEPVIEAAKKASGSGGRNGAKPSKSGSKAKAATKKGVKNGVKNGGKNRAEKAAVAAPDSGKPSKKAGGKGSKKK
jgi:DNA-binding protein HU-beta